MVIHIISPSHQKWRTQKLEKPVLNWTLPLTGLHVWGFGCQQQCPVANGNKHTERTGLGGSGVANVEAEAAARLLTGGLLSFTQTCSVCFTSGTQSPKGEPLAPGRGPALHHDCTQERCPPRKARCGDSRRRAWALVGRGSVCCQQIGEHGAIFEFHLCHVFSAQFPWAPVFSPVT